MRFNSIAGAAALSAIVAPVVAKELPVNELIASGWFPYSPIALKQLD
jgi:pheromone shutdown protein TraB